MSRWSRPGFGLGLGAVLLGVLSGSCASTAPRFGWQLPILTDTTGHELPRPRLAPGGDTNDARAYYARGDHLLHYSRWLDTADLAFYWAARLDPAWAEPLYARAAVIVRAFKRDVTLRRWRGMVQLAPRQRHLVDSLTRLALPRPVHHFNYDYHVTLDPDKGYSVYNYETVDIHGEMPGLSVFFRANDLIFHGYSTYLRGLDMFLSMYHLLDVTPLGRQEEAGNSMSAGDSSWIRYHDEYGVDGNRRLTGQRACCPD
jgi:hypothetical protein